MNVGHLSFIFLDSPCISIISFTSQPSEHTVSYLYTRNLNGKKTVKMRIFFLFSVLTAVCVTSTNATATSNVAEWEPLIHGRPCARRGGASSNSTSTSDYKLTDSYDATNFFDMFTFFDVSLLSLCSWFDVSLLTVTYICRAPIPQMASSFTKTALRPRGSAWSRI